MKLIEFIDKIKYKLVGSIVEIVFHKFKLMGSIAEIITCKIILVGSIAAIVITNSNVWDQL
jgi:hypothetical protein